jgi:hypothetical protein
MKCFSPKSFAFEEKKIKILQKDVKIACHTYVFFPNREISSNLVTLSSYHFCKAEPFFKGRRELLKQNMRRFR